ncbi:MAG: hypothetical protein AB7E24_14740 [Novosphingobium sp.]
MDSNLTAATGHANDVDAPNATMDLPDATFWAAHAQWKALTDAWNADGDTSDEEFDRHIAKVYEAFSAMWLTPIHTAYALAAKVASCNFASVELPKPAGDTLTMLEWDLGRLVMRELAPDQETLMAARNWDAALNRYRRAHESMLTQADADIDESEREVLMEPAISEVRTAFDELRELSPAGALGLADKIQVFATEYEDCPMGAEDFAILVRDARSLGGKS